MALGVQSISKCIENILIEVNRLGGELSTQMKYIETKKGKKVIKTMNRWNYIQTYTDIISMLSLPEYQEQFDLPKLPSMLETVYMLAIENTQKSGLSRSEIDVCTGVIKLYFPNDDPREDYIKTQSFGNLYYKKNPQEFSKLFLPVFAKRMMTCKTNITSLAVTIFEKDEGHANMIFIHNGPSQITFSLYEPHGSSRIGFDMYRRMDEFIDFLVKSCNENRHLFGKKYVSKQPETKISCVRGIQAIIPEEKLAGTENTGYCVMYSYLWLYITLRCSSLITHYRGRIIEQGTSFEEITVRTILQKTERVILESRTPEELGRITNAFAGLVISKYIENIKTFYGEEIFRTVQTNVFENFNPEEDYILSKTTRLLKKQQKIRNTSNLPPRKHDNQPCIDDDDCMSMFCNNKKCSPRKNDREACEFHQECISDYCDEEQKMCLEEPRRRKKS